MLFLLDEYRYIVHGKEILSHWEKLMKEKGYAFVMTSSLANEAVHIYEEGLEKAKELLVKYGIADWEI